LAVYIIVSVMHGHINIKTERAYANSIKGNVFWATAVILRFYFEPVRQRVFWYLLYGSPLLVYLSSAHTFIRITLR